MSNRCTVPPRAALSKSCPPHQQIYIYIHTYMDMYIDLDLSLTFSVYVYVYIHICIYIYICISPTNVEQVHCASPRRAQQELSAPSAPPAVNLYRGSLLPSR